MSLSVKSALVVGAGGLGCPAAVGLAAAGVRYITLVDDDTIDPTNLSRQMLFGDHEVGQAKSVAAAAALRLRWPSTTINPRQERLSRTASTRELIAAHDVVLDGTDNFPTRFLLSDLCVAEGVPLVHGAALRWLGQLLTILPGRSACLRCVFEGEPPAGAAPTCAEAGVISPLVGIVGAWMASEALEILHERPPRSAGRMRVLDAWRGRERWAEVGRDPACIACFPARVAPVSRESVAFS